MDYDYLFKLLMIGNSNVGKSAMMNRFVDDIFDDSYVSTIGVDFKIKTMTICNKVAKVQIWDTAGQERFKNITTIYYRGANGCIIVYDITNKLSFDNIVYWLSELELHAPNKIPILLVGNKKDLSDKRQVSENDLQMFANIFNLDYMEVSVKDNKNNCIDNAFIKLCEKIMKERPPPRVKETNYLTPNESKVIKIDRKNSMNSVSNNCC